MLVMTGRMPCRVCQAQAQEKNTSGSVDSNGMVRHSVEWDKEFHNTIQHLIKASEVLTVLDYALHRADTKEAQFVVAVAKKI